MLPASFFKNRTFSAANAALVLVMFAMYGSIFFLSQYLQSVQGYSALAAGVRLVPMAVLITIGSLLSARLVGRLGLKITVGGSTLLAAAGLFFLSRVATANAPYPSIALALIIFTIGLGLAMPPATAAGCRTRCRGAGIDHEQRLSQPDSAAAVRAADFAPTSTSA
jgi:predicted MFS family arabinose efflux permease